jgi:putative Ca2+/H+ antiporter (TMEM165/GDT1 family)
LFRAILKKLYSTLWPWLSENDRAPRPLAPFAHHKHYQHTLTKTAFQPINFSTKQHKDRSTMAWKKEVREFYEYVLSKQGAILISEFGDKGRTALIRLPCNHEKTLVIAPFVSTNASARPMSVNFHCYECKMEKARLPASQG